MFFAHPSSAKGWEVLADGGAWMVIIGVVGEGVEIVIKVAERSKSTSDRFKTWLDQGKIRKKCLEWCVTHEVKVELFGAAFWMLVVVGLMIELKGTHEAKKIDDADNAQLHMRASVLESNNIVLFTIGEKAKASAAQAIEAAEKAKTEREKAESGRLILQAKVIELEQQAAQTSATASNALSLSKEGAPRRLTEEQQRKLFSLLKNVPKAKFALNLDPRVDDAEGVANDLLPVMAQRGFECVGIDRMSQSGGPVNHGVNVSVIGSTNMPRELIDALNVVGLKAHPGQTIYGSASVGSSGAMKSTGVVYLDVGFH